MTAVGARGVWEWNGHAMPSLVPLGPPSERVVGR
jgi:hypothetical protein